MDQADDLGDELQPFDENAFSSRRKRRTLESQREGKNKDMGNGPRERSAFHRPSGKFSPHRHERPFFDSAEAAAEDETGALLSSEQMDPLGDDTSRPGRRRVESQRGAEAPLSTGNVRLRRDAPIYDRRPQRRTSPLLSQPTAYYASDHISSYPPGLCADGFYQDTDCSECLARRLYSERDIPRASSSRRQQGRLSILILTGARNGDPTP
nr:unnamed protein product [Spirometra erinaceieuropaei]